MTAPLRLTLKRDTDGTGELSAEVSINGFAGVGAAWFNLREISDFAETIANTFPLIPEGKYELSGGYWSSSKQDELEHVHLGLRFYPVGVMGKVGCSVHLAVQLETASAAPEYTVTAELRTNYEQLRRFGLSLVALTEGKINESLLSCTGA